MPSDVLKRLSDLFKNRHKPPVKLDLSQPPRRQIERAVEKREATRIPGNYFSFGMLLELKLGDEVHVGSPADAFRDPTTLKVRWGCRADFLLPGASVPRAPWVDDPIVGIAQRMIRSPEDLLGAEGTFGGIHYRFEQILNSGPNVVVYALYNQDGGTRAAYGFMRPFCEARPM
jgi:hypothetical protein